MNEKELKIINYINTTGRISRKEAEEILSLKKTQAVQVLRCFIDEGIIIRKGSGRSTN